jgi:hypothetical protein
MINRLYRFLFVAFVLAVPSLASAQAQQTVPSTYSFYDGGVAMASNAAACASWAARSSAQQVAKDAGTTFVCKSSMEASPWTVVITGNTAANPSKGISASSIDYTATAAPRYSCPVSTPPYTLSADSKTCTRPADCSSKVPFKAVQEFTSLAQAKSTLPQQNNMCKIKVEAVDLCTQVISTGVYKCYYTVSNTGELASSNDTTKVTQQALPSNIPSTEQRVNLPPSEQTDPLGKCPAGTVAGGMSGSGMQICMGSGTAPSNPTSSKPATTTTPEVTVSNPDGSSTAVVTVSVDNSDGSKTVTTRSTTTQPDGTKTTSEQVQTSTKPSGEQGKADDPKDSDDLCKRNPLLSMCRNSSVTGACEETTCEGDAIQCATLRAAAMMQCAQAKDKDELAKLSYKTLGDSLLAGTDPMRTASDDNLKGTTVNLSSPNLDSSGFASASCFPAKSFSVGGRTVVMDFTIVCDKISPLRYAVMAMCTLIAYLIVSKSVLGV